MGEQGDLDIQAPAQEAQPIDTAQYFKALRLQDSFYDYGLDDVGKARVVEQLKGNQSILMQSLGDNLLRGRALNMLSNICVENDNIPELQSVGYSLIDNNLQSITEAVTVTTNYGHKKEIVDYLFRLTESDNSEYREHSIATLNTIFQHDLSVPPPPEMPEEERMKYQAYLRQFESIFRYGTDDQIIQATRTAAQAMSQSTGAQRIHQGRMTTALMWSNKQSDPYDLRTQASRELTDLILKGYDVSFNDFVKAWRFYSHNSGLVDMSKRNLERIIDLEATDKGITRSLRHEASNLNLFFRYPPEILRKMYEERDNREVPYGFLDASLADHNEAFSSLSMEGLLGSLNSQLKDEGFILRIFEPGTEEGVFNVGDTLNERYGVKSAQFGIIAGHGETNGVELNWPQRGSSHMLTQEEVAQGSRKLSGFLKDGSPLILISCSTGVPGGIAQELSKDGLKVSGPDKVAAIGGLKFSKKPDSLPDLSVWFRDAKTNTFEDGELLVA